MEKASIRKLLLIAGVLLGLWVLWRFAFRGVSPEAIRAALASTGPWAPLLFLLLMSLLPLFFFSPAMLALAGGLLFGLKEGSLYTYAGALLNCALTFWILRYFFRERTEACLAKKLSPVWQEHLRKAEGKEGFILLLCLRLIPLVPYILINDAFALTRIRFWPYMLASAIGILPGTLVFINIGDKALDLKSPSFWLAIGLFVLLSLITAAAGKYLFPHQNKKEKESNEHKL